MGLLIGAVMNMAQNYLTVLTGSSFCRRDQHNAMTIPLTFEFDSGVILKAKLLRLYLEKSPYDNIKTVDYPHISQLVTGIVKFNIGAS